MDRRRRRFTMATSSGSARRAIGGPHICHPEPVISMPFLTARVSRQRARIPIPVWESLPTQTPLYGRTRS
jgi:hypothetical protein